MEEKTDGKLIIVIWLKRERGKRMKLYDYLVTLEEGTELTVWDEDYDIESYFYNDEPDDDWQTSMLELAKLLDVTEVKKRGVIINLSEVIGKKINELKEANLFRRRTVDSIMNDMENILSGYASEEWFKKFVDVLGGKEL